MERVYKPNWNVKYIKSAKKEDFVKNHTGVFEGISDKDLEKVWEKYQDKQPKTTTS